MESPREPDGRELAIDADLRDFQREAEAAGMTTDQLTDSSIAEAERAFPEPLPGLPDDPHDAEMRDAIRKLRSAWELMNGRLGP